MKKRLDLDAFGDGGFRWNDNILADMCHLDQCLHFLESAKEEIDHNEWEIAYDILRELVWRAPTWRASPWRLLSECAIKMGRPEEAEKAKTNWGILSRKNERNLRR